MSSVTLLEILNTITNVLLLFRDTMLMQRTSQLRAPALQRADSGPLAISACAPHAPASMAAIPFFSPQKQTQQQGNGPPAKRKVQRSNSLIYLTSDGEIFMVWV